MATGAGHSALEMYRWQRSRRYRRMLAAAAGVGLAVVGWMRGWPDPPVAALAAASLAVLGAGLLGPSRRRAEHWRQGAAGERRTAELLEVLPGRRWAVWHDLRVPGSRANIDHVVAGRTGVWVIDTKTTGAAVRGGLGRVRLGDRKLDVGPVRWEAEAVAAALDAAIDGPPVPVRPLVAVHGDGLRPRGVRCKGVPVVAAERLAARLRRGRRRLGRRELDLVSRAIDAAFVPGGRR